MNSFSIPSCGWIGHAPVAMQGVSTGCRCSGTGPAGLLCKLPWKDRSKTSHLTTHRHTTQAASDGFADISSSRHLPSGEARPAAARPLATPQTTAAPQTDPKQAALEPYATMKLDMLGRSRRFGGFLALYCWLTLSGSAALCVLLGTAGCNVYLRLMQQQVDGVSPDDEVPIWRAEDSTGPFRSLAIAAAAYRAALRPRLLVPIGLAAAMWAFNHQTDGALSLRDEGCLLLGFLSYKASQFMAVWDSNQARTEPSLPPRPMKEFQSEKDELTLEQVLANIASVRTLKQKSPR